MGGGIEGDMGIGAAKEQSVFNPDVLPAALVPVENCMNIDALLIAKA